MRASSLPIVAASALACLTGVNLLTSYYIAQDGVAHKSTEQDCTFIGDDYPERWPLPPANPVALVIEDPSHYPILGADARDEWASDTPKGFGYIRLGPEHRAFSVSMFHESHCLRVFRDGLAGNYRPQTVTHFGHCLVYIRQLILCAPDLTLEPYDALDRDFSVERAGSTHVCNDWRQVYDAMSSNWENWLKVRPMAKPVD
ncbi:hypothetical protein BD311DRAFT_721930 [Dichomitus squalens]|uniref:Oxidase ustYa n=1 Tax=Dichomitus squalens TaxID=114155 RepID=A0A4Q9MQI2_9APHY|nr:hypothetical protein BD311DRAFT_721930 [Dichomitus squalens]